MDRSEVDPQSELTNPQFGTEDGSRVASHSTRLRQSVFVKPVSVAAPETLALESDSATPVDWSADGQFLLIDRTILSASQPASRYT